MTVKSLKHLFALFESSDFSLVVQPKVEGPKRLPNIIFRCASLCFEAQDDPMETSEAFPSLSWPGRDGADLSTYLLQGSI